MNNVAVAAVGVWLALFWTLTILLPGDPLVVGFSAGSFVALAVGIGKWGPAAFFAFFPRFQHRTGVKANRDTSYGLTGLVTWMLAEEGKIIYRITNIQLGRPAWLPDLYVSAFLNAMSFTGVVLLVLAARFDGEKPTRLPTLLVGLLAFLGVMMSYSLPTVLADTVRWLLAGARVGLR